MTEQKIEMLNLQITVYGEEGKLAILIDGFTKQSHVDHVIKQLNKFMTDNATLTKQ